MNTELIRILISEEFEKRGGKAELPRFEKINNDENGVKILDRELHTDVQIYIKPDGIKCAYDETDDCEHVKFALTFSEVRELIRKWRKKGWKLPDA